MNPSFTRFWGRIVVAVGLVLVSSGVILAAVALVVDMPWGSITGQAVIERILVAFFLIVSGILAGAPFIVLGQMVLLELAQYRALRAIARRRNRRPGTARGVAGPPSEAPQSGKIRAP